MASSSTRVGLFPLMFHALSQLSSGEAVYFRRPLGTRPTTLGHARHQPTPALGNQARSCRSPLDTRMVNWFTGECDVECQFSPGTKWEHVSKAQTV